MQAMEIKWPASNRIVVAAIAFTMLTAGTIGFILLNQSGTGVDSIRQITVPSRPASSVTQAKDSLTYEQNTELPTGGQVAQASSVRGADYRYWEQNLELPGAMSQRTQSAAEMLHLEQNLWLPAGATRPSTVKVDYSANSPIVDR